MGCEHVREGIGVLTDVCIWVITPQKHMHQDISIIPGGNSINDHHMEHLRL